MASIFSIQNQSYKKWLLFAVLLILLDQASKLLVLYYFHYREVLPVFPGFNITLAFNKGAAFSFLAGEDGWQIIFLSAVSILASMLLIYFILKANADKWIENWAYTCILAGAVGNLIDRVRLGYVVDFINVYYKNSHFPIFNIADILINIGAVLLVLDMFRTYRAEKRLSQQ